MSVLGYNRPSPPQAQPIVDDPMKLRRAVTMGQQQGPARKGNLMFHQAGEKRKTALHSKIEVVEVAPEIPEIKIDRSKLGKVLSDLERPDVQGLQLGLFLLDKFLTKKASRLDKALEILGENVNSLTKSQRRQLEDIMCFEKKTQGKVFLAMSQQGFFKKNSVCEFLCNDPFKKNAVSYDKAIRNLFQKNFTRCNDLSNLMREFDFIHTLEHRIISGVNNTHAIEPSKDLEKMQRDGNIATTGLINALDRIHGFASIKQLDHHILDEPCIDYDGVYDDEERNPNFFTFYPDGKEAKDGGKAGKTCENESDNTSSLPKQESSATSLIVGSAKKDFNFYPSSSKNSNGEKASDQADHRVIEPDKKDIVKKKAEIAEKDAQNGEENATRNDGLPQKQDFMFYTSKTDQLGVPGKTGEAKSESLESRSGILAGPPPPEIPSKQPSDTATASSPNVLLTSIDSPTQNNNDHNHSDCSVNSDELYSKIQTRKPRVKRKVHSTNASQRLEQSYMKFNKDLKAQRDEEGMLQLKTILQGAKTMAEGTAIVDTDSNSADSDVAPVNVENALRHVHQIFKMAARDPNDPLESEKDRSSIILNEQYAALEAVHRGRILLQMEGNASETRPPIEEVAKEIARDLVEKKYFKHRPSYVPDRQLDICRYGVYKLNELQEFGNANLQNAHQPDYEFHMRMNLALNNCFSKQQNSNQYKREFIDVFEDLHQPKQRYTRHFSHPQAKSRTRAEHLETLLQQMRNVMFSLQGTVRDLNALATGVEYLSNRNEEIAANVMHHKRTQHHKNKEHRLQQKLDIAKEQDGKDTKDAKDKSNNNLNKNNIKPNINDDSLYDLHTVAEGDSNLSGYLADSRAADSNNVSGGKGHKGGHHGSHPGHHSKPNLGYTAQFRKHYRAHHKTTRMLSLELNSTLSRLGINYASGDHPFFECGRPEWKQGRDRCGLGPTIFYGASRARPIFDVNPTSVLDASLHLMQATSQLGRQNMAWLDKELKKMQRKFQYLDFRYAYKQTKLEEIKYQECRTIMIREYEYHHNLHHGMKSKPAYAMEEQGSDIKKAPAATLSGGLPDVKNEAPGAPQDQGDKVAAQAAKEARDKADMEKQLTQQRLFKRVMKMRAGGQASNFKQKIACKENTVNIGEIRDFSFKSTDIIEDVGQKINQAISKVFVEKSYEVTDIFYVYDPVYHDWPKYYERDKVLLQDTGSGKDKNAPFPDNTSKVNRAPLNMKNPEETNALFVGPKEKFSSVSYIVICRRWRPQEELRNEAQKKMDALLPKLLLSVIKFVLSKEAWKRKREMISAKYEENIKTYGASRAAQMPIRIKENGLGRKSEPRLFRNLLERLEIKEVPPLGDMRKKFRLVQKEMNWSPEKRMAKIEKAKLEDQFMTQINASHTPYTDGLGFVRYLQRELDGCLKNAAVLMNWRMKDMMSVLMRYIRTLMKDIERLLFSSQIQSWIPIARRIPYAMRGYQDPKMLKTLLPRFNRSTASTATAKKDPLPKKASHKTKATDTEKSDPNNPPSDSLNPLSSDHSDDEKNKDADAKANPLNHIFSLDVPITNSPVPQLEDPQPEGGNPPDTKADQRGKPDHHHPGPHSHPHPHVSRFQNALAKWARQNVDPFSDDEVDDHDNPIEIRSIELRKHEECVVSTKKSGLVGMGSVGDDDSGSEASNPSLLINNAKTQQQTIAPQAKNGKGKSKGVALASESVTKGVQSKYYPESNTNEDSVGSESDTVQSMKSNSKEKHSDSDKSGLKLAGQCEELHEGDERHEDVRGDGIHDDVALDEDQRDECYKFSKDSTLESCLLRSSLLEDEFLEDMSDLDKPVGIDIEAMLHRADTVVKRRIAGRQIAEGRHHMDLKKSSSSSSDSDVPKSSRRTAKNSSVRVPPNPRKTRLMEEQHATSKSNSIGGSFPDTVSSLLISETEQDDVDVEIPGTPPKNDNEGILYIKDGDPRHWWWDGVSDNEYFWNEETNAWEMEEETLDLDDTPVVDPANDIETGFIEENHSPVDRPPDVDKSPAPVADLGAKTKTKKSPSGMENVQPPLIHTDTSKSKDDDLMDEIEFSRLLCSIASSNTGSDTLCASAKDRKIDGADANNFSLDRSSVFERSSELKRSSLLDQPTAELSDYSLSESGLLSASKVTAEVSATVKKDNDSKKHSLPVKEGFLQDEEGFVQTVEQLNEDGDDPLQNDIQTKDDEGILNTEPNRDVLFAASQPVYQQKHDFLFVAESFVNDSNSLAVDQHLATEQHLASDQHNEDSHPAAAKEDFLFAPEGKGKGNATGSAAALAKIQKMANASGANAGSSAKPKSLKMPVLAGLAAAHGKGNAKATTKKTLASQHVKNKMTHKGSHPKSAFIIKPSPGDKKNQKDVSLESNPVRPCPITGIKVGDLMQKLLGNFVESKRQMATADQMLSKIFSDRSDEFREKQKDRDDKFKQEDDQRRVEEALQSAVLSLVEKNGQQGQRRSATNDKPTKPQADQDVDPEEDRDSDEEEDLMEHAAAQVKFYESKKTVLARKEKQKKEQFSKLVPSVATQMNKVLLELHESIYGAALSESHCTLKLPETVRLNAGQIVNRGDGMTATGREGGKEGRHNAVMASTRLRRMPAEDNFLGMPSSPTRAGRLSSQTSTQTSISPKRKGRLPSKSISPKRKQAIHLGLTSPAKESPIKNSANIIEVSPRKTSVAIEMSSARSSSTTMSTMGPCISAISKQDSKDPFEKMPKIFSSSGGSMTSKDALSIRSSKEMPASDSAMLLDKTCSKTSNCSKGESSSSGPPKWQKDELADRYMSPASMKEIHSTDSRSTQCTPSERSNFQALENVLGDVLGVIADKEHKRSMLEEFRCRVSDFTFQMEDRKNKEDLRDIEMLLYAEQNGTTALKSAPNEKVHFFNSKEFRGRWKAPKVLLHLPHEERNPPGDKPHFTSDSSSSSVHSSHTNSDSDTASDANSERFSSSSSTRNDSIEADSDGNGDTSDPDMKLDEGSSGPIEIPFADLISSSPSAKSGHPLKTVSGENPSCEGEQHSNTIFESEALSKYVEGEHSKYMDMRDTASHVSAKQRAELEAPSMSMGQDAQSASGRNYRQNTLAFRQVLVRDIDELNTQNEFLQFLMEEMIHWTIKLSCSHRDKWVPGSLKMDLSDAALDFDIAKMFAEEIADKERPYWSNFSTYYQGLVAVEKMKKDPPVIGAAEGGGSSVVAKKSTAFLRKPKRDKAKKKPKRKPLFYSDHNTGEYESNSPHDDDSNSDDFDSVPDFFKTLGESVQPSDAHKVPHKVSSPSMLFEKKTKAPSLSNALNARRPIVAADSLVEVDSDQSSSEEEIASDRRLARLHGKTDKSHRRTRGHETTPDSDTESNTERTESNADFNKELTVIKSEERKRKDKAVSNSRPSAVQEESSKLEYSSSEFSSFDTRLKKGREKSAHKKHRKSDKKERSSRKEKKSSAEKIAKKEQKSEKKEHKSDRKEHKSDMKHENKDHEKQKKTERKRPEEAERKSGRKHRSRDRQESSVKKHRRHENDKKGRKEKSSTRNPSARKHDADKGSHLVHQSRPLPGKHTYTKGCGSPLEREENNSPLERSGKQRKHRAGKYDMRKCDSPPTVKDSPQRYSSPFFRNSGALSHQNSVILKNSRSSTFENTVSLENSRELGSTSLQNSKDPGFHFYEGDHRETDLYEGSHRALTKSKRPKKVIIRKSAAGPRILPMNLADAPQPSPTFEPRAPVPYEKKNLRQCLIKHLKNTEDNYCFRSLDLLETISSLRNYIKSKGLLTRIFHAQVIEHFGPSIKAILLAGGKNDLSDLLAFLKRVNALLNSGLKIDSPQIVNHILKSVSLTELEDVAERKLQRIAKDPNISNFKKISTMLTANRNRKEYKSAREVFDMFFLPSNRKYFQPRSNHHHMEKKKIVEAVSLGGNCVIKPYLATVPYQEMKPVEVMSRQGGVLSLGLHWDEVFHDGDFSEFHQERGATILGRPKSDPYKSKVNLQSSAQAHERLKGSGFTINYNAVPKEVTFGDPMRQFQYYSDPDVPQEMAAGDHASGDPMKQFQYYNDQNLGTGRNRAESMLMNTGDGYADAGQYAGGVSKQQKAVSFGRMGDVGDPTHVSGGSGSPGNRMNALLTSIYEIRALREAPPCGLPNDWKDHRQTSGGPSVNPAFGHGDKHERFEEFNRSLPVALPQKSGNSPFSYARGIMREVIEDMERPHPSGHGLHAKHAAMHENRQARFDRLYADHFRRAANMAKSKLELKHEEALVESRIDAQRRSVQRRSEARIKKALIKEGYSEKTSYTEAIQMFQKRREQRMANIAEKRKARQAKKAERDEEEKKRKEDAKESQIPRHKSFEAQREYPGFLQRVAANTVAHKERQLLDTEQQRKAERENLEVEKYCTFQPFLKKSKYDKVVNNKRFSLPDTEEGRKQGNDELPYQRIIRRAQESRIKFHTETAAKFREKHTFIPNIRKIKMNEQSDVEDRFHPVNYMDSRLGKRMQQGVFDRLYYYDVLWNAARKSNDVEAACELMNTNEAEDEILMRNASSAIKVADREKGLAHLRLNHEKALITQKVLRGETMTDEELTAIQEEFKKSRAPPKDLYPDFYAKKSMISEDSRKGSSQCPEAAAKGSQSPTGPSGKGAVSKGAGKTRLETAKYQDGKVGPKPGESGPEASESGPKLFMGGETDTSALSINNSHGAAPDGNLPHDIASNDIAPSEIPPDGIHRESSNIRVSTASSIEDSNRTVLWGPSAAVGFDNGNLQLHRESTVIFENDDDDEQHTLHGGPKKADLPDFHLRQEIADAMGEDEGKEEDAINANNMDDDED